MKERDDHLPSARNDNIGVQSVACLPAFHLCMHPALPDTAKFTQHSQAATHQKKTVTRRNKDLTDLSASEIVTVDKKIKVSLADWLTIVGAAAQISRLHLRGDEEKHT